MEEGQSVREETSARAEGANPYVIPISILIAGGLIAGAVLYSNGSGAGLGSTDQQAAAGTAAVASAADLVDDDAVLGDPSAPLTIVEFADFQCPYCGKFFLTTEKQIIEQYVKTGKVKFVYRDFPLNSIHAEAQKAAEASECAKDQGKFWDYHDVLYQRQASLSLQSYKQWAAELGLNAATFNQCLDSGKYAEEVQKDFSDGAAIGINSTPSAVVGTRLRVGALPFEDYQDENNQTKPGFRTVIEEELAKLEK